jgi:transcriptional regulator with XRE-family HTH domain
MTGEELKELRIRRRITQQRLGELLGYQGHSAQTTIQCWEYDKAPIPLKHFRKLAQILEVPVERFVP